MLRRIEDKEFPSLELENMRAHRVLGDQLALSPQVTYGWETESQRRTETAQGYAASVGRARVGTQAKVQAKFRENPKFSLIPYTVGRRKESFWVVQI